MIGTLTMDDLAKVRRMSRTDAEAFIAGHRLSAEEKEKVLSLAGKSMDTQGNAPRQSTYDDSRRVWFLAAWLAGASWRQLAFLHQVAPQTVISSVDRLMQSEKRQKLRLVHRASPEKLSAYRAYFIQHQERLKKLTPMAVAKELLTIDTDTEI